VFCFTPFFVFLKYPKHKKTLKKGELYATIYKGEFLKCYLIYFLIYRITYYIIYYVIYCVINYLIRYAVYLNLRETKMFEKILEEIKKYDTVIIHRHLNPDGDAIGSQVGLKYMLAQAFPEKKVYAVGDYAGRYAFIEGSVMDEISDKTYENALAIVLDTSAKSLISDVRYLTAKSTARLDHHIFVEQICKIEVTDTSYESCCGLVTDFAIECGFNLSPIAAKALYTGMVTDSGRFRYDSTTSKTHALASHLMKTEFQTGDIYSNLYQDDLYKIQLRAKFTLKIQDTGRGVAYIYTTLEEAKGYDADNFTISRGMVNTMGEIKGIYSWANFTETEDGVLCEIRSSKYNINPIAVAHGGGGHQKASGATLKDRAEAESVVSELIALHESAKIRNE